ncbi:hypothetical protein [Spirilliplanes yamanashiensis]|uniref:Zinc-finger domain-containing protein n=1 Tax=Spirilliplanes yamanashiensis TaxID=42233 RepID=A0A8J3Y4G2_9ACTN|nr:hypothetical protein [Spirilliplanes yamanashiensis]MDP9819617.1 hypothetical protein [Spirilliplanes yamanashiensis]GIJ01563.1 hypothetical protein Sya03_09150 [Spirilliplanes yamanashiensis]
MNAHVPDAQLTAYAAGDPGLADALCWGIEVHLESCPWCRERLGAALDGPTAALVARVGAALAPAGPATAPPPAPLRGRARRAVRRWTTWSLLPRLAVTAGAVGAALALELLMPAYPSPVLLVAPVAPLFGVAAAWSRRGDPAWELIAGTPQGGLLLLLRRTLVVLAALVPVLAVAGGLAGQNPALWLLPALGGTAATLALGSRIGVSRAAAVVAATWAAAVVVPALTTARLPALLTTAGLPGWALATAALAALVWARAGDFRLDRSFR